MSHCDLAPEIEQAKLVKASKKFARLLAEHHGTRDINRPVEKDANLDLPVMDNPPPFRSEPVKIRERIVCIPVYIDAAKQKSRPSIGLIMSIVADFYSIDLEELQSQRRQADSVFARQVIMYLSKDMTPRSYPEIGRYLGGRDHTTVMHGFRKIERCVLADAKLAAEIAELRARIVSEVQQFTVAA